MGAQPLWPCMKNSASRAGAGVFTPYVHGPDERGVSKPSNQFSTAHAVSCTNAV